VPRAITYIDGEAGILQHRGYPIEQLCEHVHLSRGRLPPVSAQLPTQDQLDEWIHEITIHTYVHENIKEFMAGFRYDAHPMGHAAGDRQRLSSFLPDAKTIEDPEQRRMAAIRLIAQDADAGRFSHTATRWGCRTVNPDNDLGLRRQLPRHALQDGPSSSTSSRTRASPRRSTRSSSSTPTMSRNCSTEAVRAVGSSQVDPYSAVAAGVGGALRPTARRRQRGGAAHAQPHRQGRDVPDFLKGVKDGKEKLMGFGHRVYKNYDPRARIIKKHVDEVFEVTGHEPEARHRRRAREARARRRVLHRAQALPERRLLLGPDLRGAAASRPTMFTVMFAIPRTSGWIAQWLEMVQDDETKIARPRQIYAGRARPRLRADRSALVAGAELAGEQPAACLNSGPRPRRHDG
jgi:citrate synthase